MINIVKYESKRFFSKRKNRLLILILLIFIVGVNVYNYHRYKSYSNNIIREYMLTSTRAESMAGVLNARLRQFNRMMNKEKMIYKEEIQKIKGEAEYLETEASITRKISYAYSKVEDYPEWNRVLCRYLSERYTNVVDSYEKGYIDNSYLMERQINIKEAIHNKYKYDYFVANNIRLQTNEYELTGANTLSLLFTGNNILIMMLIIALLSMDVFLSTLTEGSYKLECTQPFHRKKIFLGKILCTLLIVFSILFTVFLLNLIINSIIFGVGDFSYPQIVSGNINKLILDGNQGDFIVISLSSKLIRGVFMIISLVILTISLVTLLAVFTDSMEKALGVSYVLLFAAFTFKIVADKESAINLIYPYMYCFYEDVVSGYYRFNYLFGILINITLSMLSIFISYLKFKGKDFLGVKE